jgi:uncharacterized protein (DUF427 family)
LERTPSRVVVALGGTTIAETERAWRVLETSHPSGYYVPLEDVRPGSLEPSTTTTLCEWKGVARYFDVVAGRVRRTDAAWAYPEPMPGFEPLADLVSFYPRLMDGCWVDGEPVRPQEGPFYGGWITASVVGPFKGEPGSMGW